MGRLKKEEKAHDERMNDSNTRIKQAGTSYHVAVHCGLRCLNGSCKVRYTRRRLKRAHAMLARNMPVMSISSAYLVLRCLKRNSKLFVRLLGHCFANHAPDSNHALLVTQQHTSTTYSVAASLSRVADAEWVRTCESIRRFSPSIGPLGEWRALCEGAWIGPLPDDLPDVSLPPAQISPPNQGVTEWGQTIPTATQQQYPGSLPFPSQTTLVDLERPRPAFSSNEQNQGSINSITTLSSFPFPPTHFPIPLATNEAELHRQRMQMQSLQVPQPSQTVQKAHMLSESPKPIESALSDTQTLIGNFNSPPVSQGQMASSSSQYTFADNHPGERILHGNTGSVIYTGSENKVPEQSQSREEAKPRRPSLITRPTSSDKSTSSKLLSIKQPKQPPRLGEREFGASMDTPSTFKNRSIDVAKMSLERTDSSVSNGSIVAVMRSRYSRTVSLWCFDSAHNFQPNFFLSDRAFFAGTERCTALADECFRPRFAVSAYR